MLTHRALQAVLPACPDHPNCQIGRDLAAGGTSLRYEGRGAAGKTTPFVPQGRATSR